MTHLTDEKKTPRLEEIEQLAQGSRARGWIHTGGVAPESEPLTTLGIASLQEKRDCIMLFSLRRKSMAREEKHWIPSGGHKAIPFA